MNNNRIRTPKYKKMLGERFVLWGQKLQSYGNELQRHSSAVPDVWRESENTGEPNTAQNTAEYSFNDLCNFFVSAIDSGKVQAQVVANMSISIVLDWLEKQDLSDISVDRLFLLKHYVEARQRYMYVAFLGSEGQTLLEDLDLVKCYISKEDSSEMKEIFQDKSLYVVPLEK